MPKKKGMLKAEKVVAIMEVFHGDHKEGVQLQPDHLRLVARLQHSREAAAAAAAAATRGAGFMMFNEKDLTRICAKEKGVVAQSVMDVLKEEMDGMYDSDMLGSSKIYWSLKSTESHRRKARRQNVMDEIDKVSADIRALKKRKQDSEEEAANGMSERERGDCEHKKASLLKQKEALVTALGSCVDSAYYSSLQQVSTTAFDAANRWTDNIFVARSYMESKLNVEKADVNTSARPLARRPQCPVSLCSSRERRPVTRSADAHARRARQCWETSSRSRRTSTTCRSDCCDHDFRPPGRQCCPRARSAAAFRLGQQNSVQNRWALPLCSALLPRLPATLPYVVVLDQQPSFPRNLREYCRLHIPVPRIKRDGIPVFFRQRRECRLAFELAETAGPTHPDVHIHRNAW